MKDSNQKQWKDMKHDYEFIFFFNSAYHLSAKIAETDCIMFKEAMKTN